ncbi:MAG: GTP-binding protein [Sulfurospirillum cavolei]|nr:GTP-binding protein [Sulfurospirillum cavolei]
MKTRIILVGGFLGAGKTTLLGASAQKLFEEGKRVGLITNDQASALVDTAFLRRINDQVAEVSGSCFCCNFNGFADAILTLQKDREVDVIIAEPVGSCTDLSATVMQPLKEKFQETLLVSPLSVLVDPRRLEAILQNQKSNLHESAAYILQKQLDEADVIVIAKEDLLCKDALEALMEAAKKRWPLAHIFALSAQSGEGLDAWLTEVTEGRLDAGGHIVEVDYDVYAQGEAVLGWLNTTWRLHGKSIDWNAFVAQVLHDLSERLERLSLTVGHVKVFLETPTSFIRGNITGTHESPEFQGGVERSDDALITVNARVETSPEALERLVSEVLVHACGDAMTYTITVCRCLQPGRPNPTYRYARTVSV